MKWSITKALLKFCTTSHLSKVLQGDKMSIWQKNFGDFFEKAFWCRFATKWLGLVQGNVEEEIVRKFRNSKKNRYDS